MTTTERICREQDCKIRTSRPNHPLCYDHYVDMTNEAISLCTNCQSEYKPAGFPVCRSCYRSQRSGERQYSDQVGGAGWNEAPAARTAAVLPAAVKAVELVRRNIQEYETACNNHESNTTQYLVEPLLRGLGWDTSDPSQVQREYRLGGRRRYRSAKWVDIALLRDGKPIAFIEVKRLDRDYHQEYESQLEGYASYLDNGVAILTNGMNWLIRDVTNGVTTPSPTINVWDGPAGRVVEQLSRFIGNTPIASANQPVRSTPRVTRQPRRTPTAEQIMDALKEYRGREAQRRRRPAYAIFNDNTIVQIAAVKPANDAELQSIRGVGPTTVKQHGEAILKIVAGR